MQVSLEILGAFVNAVNLSHPEIWGHAKTLQGLSSLKSRRLKTRRTRGVIHCDVTLLALVIVIGFMNCVPVIVVVFLVVLVDGGGFGDNYWWWCLRRRRQR